jgi:hypothetical protein
LAGMPLILEFNHKCVQSVIGLHAYG